MPELCEIGASDLRRLISRKEASPLEILESCIRRIEQVDGVVNAIPIRCFEQARSEADTATRAVMRGDVLPELHGLPVAIKDMNHVRGLRTTFGSPLYKDFVAEADDIFVGYVKKAGGIVVGKTNTTEFGAGSNTTNNVFGATRNPFNRDRTSGGSSGGAAAALATDMVPLCTGNDTGGSLRVPSGFCGTVCLRPTQGTIPYERRVFALGTFQVQGPMARTVDDTELLFRVMAQHHGIDAMSQRLAEAAPGPVDLSTVRVAFSADLGFAPTTSMIRAVFERKTKQFKPVFKAAEVDHPDIASTVEVNWIMRGMQFLALHGARYKTHRDMLGPLVVENYESARKLSVDEMIWAKMEQVTLHRKMHEFFERHDFLVVPVSTIPAFPVEQLYPPEVDGVVQETYVRWAGLTNGLSVVDCPIVVLPCGVDDTGLPFGLQIVGKRGDDYRVLAFARELEAYFANNRDLRRPRPNISSLAKSD